MKRRVARVYQHSARAAAGARRVQLVVLAAVVAGLVAMAAMIPLVTNSVARAMVDNRVSALGDLGRSVEARAVGTDGRVPIEELAPVVGEQWDGLAGPVVGQYRVDVGPLPPDAGHRITLLARDGFCQRVQIVAGECPTRRFDVAISRASAKALGLEVGDQYRVVQFPRNRDRVNRTLTVRAVFSQSGHSGYWRGLDVSDVPVDVRPDGSRVRSHDWLVDATTFAGAMPDHVPRGTEPSRSTRDSPDSVGWADVETTVNRSLSQGAFSYDRLDQARSALATTQERAASGTLDTSVTEQVSTVDEHVGKDVEQLRMIGPLLLAQLVVLQAVLTWIVVRAMLTQRRREVALMRLRAPGRLGAAMVLRRELGPSVVIGLPIGLGAAYALDWLVRSTWMSGTAGGWSWSALAVAAAVWVLTLGTVTWLIRRLVSRPVAGLLRDVQPRARRWRLSVGETVLLTLAVGMMATVVTGTLSGPPVLVTPIAMALAVGLVLGGLMVPIAGRVAARVLRRGRVATLLALTSLSRRSSTRNIVLALTAAGAMVTFGIGALQLGEINRQHAAEAEVGAPVRLTITNYHSNGDPKDFVKIIDRLDPKHEVMTPVLRMRSGNSDGPVVLAGDPGAMSRIALDAGGGDPWAKLRTGTSPQGALPAAVAHWSPPVEGDSEFSAPALAVADKDFETIASVPLIPGAEEHTFITSLWPLLADAVASPSLSAEIWATTQNPALLKRAESDLKDAGFGFVIDERVSKVKSELDQSASAYGLQLGVLVALGAVIVACLVLLATLSAQARGRAEDTRALRAAQVPSAVIGRAGRAEVLLMTVPIVIGAALGWVGVWLAAPGVPWFSQPPPYDIASRTPPLLGSLIGATAAVAVTAAVGVIGIRTFTRVREEKS